MLKITYTFFNSISQDILTKEFTLVEVEQGISNPFTSAVEKAGYSLVDVSSVSMIHSTDELAG